MSSNSRGKSSGYYDENIDRVTSVDDIFSLIDGVFTPARATGFFTLQAILVRIKKLFKTNHDNVFSCLEFLHSAILASDEITS